MASPDVWAWVHCALPGVRPGHSPHTTYDTFAYDELPPAPANLDDKLHWLAQSPAAYDPIGNTSRIDELRNLAGTTFDRLPVGCVLLAERADLQQRVGSPTGCWMTFGDQAEILAGGDELVRIISDQQDCEHWYVRLKPDGNHDVVCGYFPYCTDRTDWTDDDAEAYAGEERLVICAASFTEFVWRFALEARVWRVLAHGLAPTPDEEAYISHYR